MGQLPFRENLEQFNNPEEVRRRLAEGKYRPPFDGIAQSYLASVDRAVSDKTEALRAAHDEAMLASAKEANRIASEANEEQRAATEVQRASIRVASSAKDAQWRASRWAMYAAIIAIVGIVYSNRDQILSVIFGHP